MRPCQDPRRCWPWAHAWGLWEKTSAKCWGERDRLTGVMTTYEQPRVVEGQERRCTRCGKYQRASL